METINWVRDNTPADAVIATDSAPVFYRYTGRKAIRIFIRPYATYYFDYDPVSAASLDRFEAHLRDNRISYIVVTPMRGSSHSDYFHQVLSAAIRLNPRAFRLVQQFSQPGYMVYAYEQSEQPDNHDPLTRQRSGP
jgi:hypothetical protein